MLLGAIWKHWVNSVKRCTRIVEFIGIHTPLISSSEMGQNGVNLASGVRHKYSPFSVVTKWTFFYQNRQSLSG
jgi:hypothetical protein